MIWQQKARAAQSDDNISLPSRAELEFDGYELKSTLDEYEVEEVCGLDMARLFPTAILGGEAQGA